MAIRLSLSAKTVVRLRRSFRNPEQYVAQCLRLQMFAILNDSKHVCVRQFFLGFTLPIRAHYHGYREKQCYYR